MANANVIEFTAQNWEAEVIKSDKPVMVDFWAPWCGPCRQLAPTIDSLATKYSGKIKVGKLNTDDHPDIAVRYSISGIPAVLFFKGGDQPKEQERVVGLQREDAFVKVLDRMLPSTSVAS
jgi:thioredoxin 1